MAALTINLHKPHKGQLISFQAQLVRSEPGYALVRAPWGRAPLELGYVTFETSDQFFEHYYADRWYAVFELRSADGMLKGWYCNVARPAVITATSIESEDLDLDLFVSPDRQTRRRLDVEEFEQRNLLHSDPTAYTAAYAALAELEQLASTGAAPFDAPRRIAL
jgi:protein associated with RNAse G/E